jgi:pimeloyl-ACP methyl ester carboxylesterase
VAHGAPSNFAVNYASIYGNQDLKGLVLLGAEFSGRPVIAKRGNETNTYNLTQQIDSMIASSGWAINSTFNNARAQYALDNPGAPAEYPVGTPLTPTTNPATNKTWANITEWATYNFQNNGFGNFSGGFSNVTVMLQYLANAENLEPRRTSLETSAYVDWVNCPYLTYDFDDHYKEIDVPVLALSSQPYHNSTGTFRFVNGLATSDFTGLMLPNYGQQDLVIGTNSARDVKQPVLDWMVNHSVAGWTLTTSARSLKAYPNLQETIWQKTPATPPNGQYDKIALHRLVKTGITPKGVIFVCPRAAWSGEAWISNPPTDNWTKTENNSQPIYWANRGFEVYAIDYRTHFVPGTLNNSQLAFMQNWTYTLWVSDVKEAVDKTKEVSGASKVFMAGPSNGGGITMMYASKYWQEDLRGIILIDALIYNGRAPIAAKNTTGTNTFNLTKQISDMIATATWSTANFAPPARTQYFIDNPGAPAEYPPGTPLTPTINPLTNKTWTNATEYMMYTLQNGGTSNLYEGYGNVTECLLHFLAGDPFTSRRLALEGEAMSDWTNCPYVPYDFDDHFKEINVPLLAFASGPIYSNKTGTFQFVNGINNTD